MPQSTGAATMTGRTGPGLVYTAIVAPNIRRVTLDIEDSVGRIDWTDNTGLARFVEWDLTLTTALTDTIAALVNTFVVAGS